MKTTLEIPDALFRRAKSAAAEKGIPFRELVSQALAEKLNPHTSAAKPWMKSFGKLKHLRADIAEVNRVIDDEFGKVDLESWK